MPLEPQGAADEGAGANRGLKTKYNRRSNANRTFKPSFIRGEKTYAALDLGTNNCRLLVAKPEGSSFRVLDAFSRIVRLGEGLAATGKLSDDAMTRAIEALKVCKEKIDFRRVNRVGLIATEACRQATNGEEFLERVQKEAGLTLKIISRRTEARLAATGCSPLVECENQGVLIFDIGGGSSELVWLTAKARKAGPPSIKMHDWASLPTGVVTMAERFGGQDVTPELFENMVKEAERLIARFASRLPRGEKLKGMSMLGTSGTVTTLAGLHLNLPRYERRLVDGTRLEAGELDAVIGSILSMSYEERRENNCIGPERADLVLAGCAILDGIRRQFPISGLRVADRGLREGILFDLMNEDQVWRQHA
jgi:exopolyphosphatase / guanosine-5'-triphosphate,3'-diphosphate pyrophosphatase